MISIQEAKNLIGSSVQLGEVTEMQIMRAAGNVLAADVFAAYDIPGFAQSAMDGYAIRFEDRNESLQIQGEMRAGEGEQKNLQKKFAIRIFTGAPVPDGADTVVMQEKVEIENAQINISDEQLEKGKNVRPKGSEIGAGQLAMKKGSPLTPAAIGFLCGIGIASVKVYKQPKVSIIVTGSELVPPGSALGFGEVFESNSYALYAALKQIGIEEIDITRVADEPEELTANLREKLGDSDMVLLTGGISVGKYDFVLDAVNGCGVNQHFHRVKQKPGKPLYFGTRAGKPVFGLPGNPSSVLTCFYEYVVPAIESLTGNNEMIKRKQALLSGVYNKPAGLGHFLKGHFEDGKAEVLGAQESYRMNSFARANCLIYLPEETTTVKDGDTVEIHLLPI